MTAHASPLVSVVLTTFNRATLLPRAIDSVLGQTFDSFELIVVDDGSTDGTGGVLAGCTDPRVSVVRHRENQGLSEARNTGSRKARGTFVCFHDDDDEWMKDKLAVQLEVMAQQEEPTRVL